MSLLLGIEVELVVASNSEDLFDSLFTERGSTDGLVREDISVVRFEFEMDGMHKFIWILKLENLANPGTNLERPLFQALRSLLADGRLKIILTCSLMCSSADSFGWRSVRIQTAKGMTMKSFALVHWFQCRRAGVNSLTVLRCVSYRKMHHPLIWVYLLAVI